MAEIYALIDPRNGEVRYIGKANNSADRLKTHIRDSRRRHTPVYCWVKKLGGMGLVPIVEVLMVTDDWQFHERRLIELSRARGDRILNVADGGDEPKCSHETLVANGHALTKRLRDDPTFGRIREIKLYIANALREGYLTNATRAKLRECAAKCPEVYGRWATIQDRSE